MSERCKCHSKQPNLRGPQGFQYVVRPADPMYLRDYPDAHVVVKFYEGRVKRELGPWTTKAVAVELASALNDRADGELL